MPKRISERGLAREVSLADKAPLHAVGTKRGYKGGSGYAGDTGGWIAVCDCGWEGNEGWPLRNKRMAQSAALEHLKACAPKAPDEG